MRHFRAQSLLASASVALAACSSNYHPEYHPVTVSNFSQNVAYAPPSPYAGASTEGPPVVVLPSPPVVIVPGAPAGEVPPELFR